VALFDKVVIALLVVTLPAGRHHRWPWIAAAS
jgi:hypothetical protein